jgi:7-carboxy-7-deazaguanine synthase
VTTGPTARESVALVQQDRGRAIYVVKEIYATLQGEGMNTGRAAVFCRFAGCNLWSGREQDRATAKCSFCDTDFVGVSGPGGGKFAGARELAEAIVRRWPGGDARFVVLTGGEPLLQADGALISALHERGFEVAVETNGTQPALPGLDWICVSPKAATHLVLRSGDELKLVYPQPGAEPSRYEGLGFDHFLLQPMDGPNLLENTRAAAQYCATHERWQLSLQTHKLMGIR